MSTCCNDFVNGSCSLARRETRITSCTLTIHKYISRANISARVLRHGCVGGMARFGTGFENSYERERCMKECMSTC